MNNTTTKTKQTIDVRKLVFTALLSAMAVVLMKFLAFKIPIMPGFISFDFSECSGGAGFFNYGAGLRSSGVPYKESGRVPSCRLHDWRRRRGFELYSWLSAGNPCGAYREQDRAFHKACGSGMPCGRCIYGAGRRCDQLFHRISAVHPQLCRWKPSSECIRRYGRALIRSSSVWWYSICRSLL